MPDDLTHSVTIEVRGNYPHGIKPHASVVVHGVGDLAHMLDAFRAALVAAGFSPATAARLGLLDGPAAEQAVGA